MTTSSGWASFIARMASWTTPSSSHAPEPSSSLVAGDPEQQHGGHAEGVGLAGLLDGVVDREAVDPGHRLDRRAPVEPVLDEQRIARAATGSSSVSRTRSRRTPVLRRRRRRVWGKAMGSEDTGAVLGAGQRRRRRTRSAAVRNAARSRTNPTVSAARCASGGPRKLWPVSLSASSIAWSAGLNGNSGRDDPDDVVEGARHRPARDEREERDRQREQEGEQRRRPDFPRQRRRSPPPARRRPARRRRAPPPRAGSAPTAVTTKSADPARA